MVRVESLQGKGIRGLGIHQGELPAQRQRFESCRLTGRQGRTQRGVGRAVALTERSMR
jgi:hypothetical protein